MSAKKTLPLSSTASAPPVEIGVLRASAPSGVVGIAPVPVPATKVSWPAVSILRIRRAPLS